MAPENGFRVVVAGGGVAGIEAALALRSLSPTGAEVTVLCPADTFEYRPLLVAEPFGGELATRLELGPVLADAGATQVRERFESVDPAARVVRTDAGSELGYDALLVALGARPRQAVPGALTFAEEAERAAFRGVLWELGRRGKKRLAFIVPAQATWSIAAYELALLTAAERDARELEGVELFLVTRESMPLELFGEPASQLVAAKLEEAGIELVGGRVATEFADHELRFGEGDPLAVDSAVSLPRLEVPRFPGLPQRDDGFVKTDARMHVEGLDDVWAAGDVTSFPVKQGGLAAQQADVAAGSIAARAGAHVPARPFQPVLRAALITGGPLEFLRSDGPGRGKETAGARALWWPPMKVAGSHIGPLLAKSLGDDDSEVALAELGGGSESLVDLDPSDEPDADEAEREEAIELVLAAADADAELGEYESALRWLELVEQLDLVLPAAYAAKRYEWRRALDPSAAPDTAAIRVDPGVAGPDAALSDLQRRLGWLRELERRSEREMGAHLNEVAQGIERVVSLSKKTGNLPRKGR